VYAGAPWAGYPGRLGAAAVVAEARQEAGPLEARGGPPPGHPQARNYVPPPGS
jgi:hypothetical protein